MLGHWPAFDIDPSGNLYATWDESGRGTRPAGIWYATSTDEGRTWSAPVKVNDRRRDGDLAVDRRRRRGPGRHQLARGRRDAAGQQRRDPGRPRLAPHGRRHRPGPRLRQRQRTGTARPRPSAAPSRPRTRSTPARSARAAPPARPCAIDRRLGDYFSMDVDATGRMYLGYADTRTPGRRRAPRLRPPGRRPGAARGQGRAAAPRRPTPASRAAPSRAPSARLDRLVAARRPALRGRGRFRPCPAVTAWRGTSTSEEDQRQPRRRAGVTPGLEPAAACSRATPRRARTRCAAPPATTARHAEHGPGRRQPHADDHHPGGDRPARAAGGRLRRRADRRYLQKEPGGDQTSSARLSQPLRALEARAPARAA